LQTGKEVVLRDGDLALATFKSMAIPSFLEPVEDNGKFYVDGGVVNNFPIDVALSLGADIIIAVDISAEASKIKSYNYFR
jgi:NTE family protein